MKSQHRNGKAEQAVQALVSAAAIEVIPVKGAELKLRALPPSTTITITCSAKFGLERTLDHCAIAVDQGYRVVPHLAARQVVDEAELRSVLRRLDALGVRDLFVVGGDAETPEGEYAGATELIEALARFDHGLTSIGVACYPEGHPKFDDDALLSALRAKQQHADYMVSQLCFDSAALVGWLGRVRAHDITLPLHVGLAAPMSFPKLAELSLRIGVGSSLRYVSKQHGILGALLPGRAYKPESLLYEMGDALSDPRMDIAGVHLFSFNQIDATLQWQDRIVNHRHPIRHHHEATK